MAARKFYGEHAWLNFPQTPAEWAVRGKAGMADILRQAA